MQNSADSFVSMDTSISCRKHISFLQKARKLPVQDILAIALTVNSGLLHSLAAPAFSSYL